MSGADSVPGKLTRAGVIEGGYCFSATSCSAAPSTTRIKISWWQAGIFGAGGQVYIGGFLMSTHASVVDAMTALLDEYPIKGTSAIDGKTITGTCAGLMTYTPALVMINVTCTVTVTGGTPMVVQEIVIGVDDQGVHRQAHCPVVGCSDSPGRYLFGAYFL